MKILEPYQKALELSYSALSKHPKKRTIWRRLSVFTTYFDHNMAASIVSSKSIKAEEVLEILESLRKDRLVDYDEAKGFSLHVLVQAFLIEKLAKEEKAQLEGGNAYYFAGALALSTRHFLRTGRIQEAGFLFIKRYYRFYAACHWAFKHDSKLYAVLIKENFLFLAAILFDAGETGDLSSWVRFDCFNYPLTSSGDPYLDAVRYFLLGCTHIVNGSDDCQELFQAAQGCLEEVQGDDSHLRDQLLTLINLRLAEFWRRFADYERTRSLYRECWLGLRNHPEPVVWVAGLCAYSKFLHDIKRPRLARRCEDEIRRLVKERLEPSWQSLVESAIAPPKNRKNRWLTACGEDYYQYFVVPPSEFRKTVESWEPKHDKEFQK